MMVKKVEDVDGLQMRKRPGAFWKVQGKHALFAVVCSVHTLMYVMWVNGIDTY